MADESGSKNSSNQQDNSGQSGVTSSGRIQGGLTNRRAVAAVTKEPEGIPAVVGQSQFVGSTLQAVNPMGIGLIAAQIVAATVKNGVNLSDYFTKDNSVVPLAVKDDKLILAVKIAKRLVELAGE